MGYTPPEDKLGILSKIFQTATSAKIIDFFLDHRDLDYSLAEIAQHSNISAQTVARDMPNLEGIGLVTNNRKVGKAIMYRLNSNLKAIELLSEFTLRMSQLPSFQEYQKPTEIQNAMQIDIEHS